MEISYTRKTKKPKKKNSEISKIEQSFWFLSFMTSGTSLSIPFNQEIIVDD